MGAVVDFIFWFIFAAIIVYLLFTPGGWILLLLMGLSILILIPIIILILWAVTLAVVHGEVK